MSQTSTPPPTPSPDRSASPSTEEPLRVAPHISWEEAHPVNEEDLITKAIVEPPRKCAFKEFTGDTWTVAGSITRVLCSRMEEAPDVTIIVHSILGDRKPITYVAEFTLKSPGFEGPYFRLMKYLNEPPVIFRVWARVFFT